MSKDPNGEPEFDTRMMTFLLLYAYCLGIVSPRKIERACYEDLAFRVLTANQQPDYSRISEFRLRNPYALNDLCVQILLLCQKVDMVSLGIFIPISRLSNYSRVLALSALSHPRANIHPCRR